MDGRLADAERLGSEAPEMGLREAADEEMIQSVSAHQLGLRWEQDRLHDLIQPAQTLADHFPELAAWRVALTFIHALSGDRDRARRLFRDLATNRFSGVPRDSTWLASMAMMSEACVALAEREQASVLTDLLCPFRDRFAHVNMVVWAGSVAYYLGILATLTDQPDEACRHLEHAFQANERTTARPALARTRYALATALVARGQDADLDQARMHVIEAWAMARRIGLPRVEREATALAGRLGRARP